MTNKTTYDADLINDASKVLTKKYKCIIAFSIAILLVMECYIALAYGIGMRSVNMIPILGIILVFAIGYARISGYKRALVQRINVISHEDTVTCEYEIDSEKIVMSTKNGTNTLYHKDIKKIQETKFQYVVIYNGGVFALISKSGFEGEENFRELVK